MRLYANKHNIKLTSKILQMIMPRSSALFMLQVNTSTYLPIHRQSVKKNDSDNMQADGKLNHKSNHPSDIKRSEL